MGFLSSFFLSRSLKRLALFLAVLGVSVIAAMLAVVRGDVTGWLSLFGLQAWLTLALAVAGLFALGVGIVSALFGGRSGGSAEPRNKGNVPLIALGLAIVVFVGTVMVKHPSQFVQLVAGDYVDAEGMARLKRAVLTSGDGTASSDWPEWRGPKRDGVSSETGVRTDWTKAPPPVVWKQPLGGGYSSIAVVSGRLYTQDKQGSDERVVCLDAATGKELWVYRYEAGYGSFRGGYNRGPRATPTVHDGRVYAVGASGILLCLDANPVDGQAKLLWRKNLRQEFDAPLPTWGFAGSPLIEGDLVIVHPGGKKGTVAAFNRRDGRLVWTAFSDPAGYSSPIAATFDGVRHILSFTGNALAGLRPEDGHVLWRYPWETAFDANIATPVVAGNYVFISSSYNKGCALLEVTGDKSGGAKVKPVYIRRNKLMRNHHDTCVLVGGHLYGFDAGVLKCVDLPSAEEKWATRDLAKGSIVAAAGHLIVLTEDGALALVEAAPDAYRQKGLMPNLLQGPECWAMPVLAGGRLFVRGHHEILCLDMRP